MSRLVFKKGKQRSFFEKIKSKSGLNWENLAKEVNISGKTLRYWRNEKYLPQQRAVLKLSRLYKIPIPKILEVKEDYWGPKKIFFQRWNCLTKTTNRKS